MMGNIYDFLTQLVFWQALLLTLWFGWHWWYERTLAIFVLTLTYLVITIHFGRLVVAYAYDVDGIGVDTWWGIATTSGIALILGIVVTLAFIGRATHKEGERK
jgi:hypothetical protein